jgi:hypothetical protein
VSEYENAQALFDALSAPFPSEDIDWRVGSTTADKSKGMALAYIDARTVMDRLDACCGVDGWENEYSFGPGSMVVCKLSIRMPDGTLISKCDGAGETDVEGQKGALSDALKRAAVRFGVGRYLYGMGSPWVAISPMGKSFKIADGEHDKLNEIHDKFAQRINWGNPAEVAVYKLLLHVVKNFVTQPSDVIEFRENNKGLIPQLRVAMRRNLEQQLDRIGGPQQQAAE